ncbi:hypothetical protein ACSBR1_004399 [Camellia fascicularis]
MYSCILINYYAKSIPLDKIYLLHAKFTLLPWCFGAQEVLERDQIMNKFQEVTACLEQALGGISYKKLDNIFIHYVELVLAQFRRAKGRVDALAPDVELSDDLLYLYNKNNDASADPAVIRRVAEKLQLMGIDDLTQESLALHEMWCEANGIEPPKQPHSQPNKSSSACSPVERTIIKTLLDKLTSSNPEDQRSAADEIRLLAKRNVDNRAASAKAGAIPLLVGLLSTPDSRTQEHAVTALLNFSIYEDNKGSIISSGAVPGIVHVLKKGSMEARENTAATLFSLSVVDENKVTIGAWGAIPPLITLPNECTQRGKKDAATALFNLCIYQGNKGKAVRAEVVPILMQLITKTQSGMVDEALAILAILSSHDEGKVAIGATEAILVLVEVIGNGSPRNKENATAVLAHLCSGDQQYLIEAQKLGVMGLLVDLAQNGTYRGKRKATQLLERISRFVEQ